MYDDIIKITSAYQAELDSADKNLQSGKINQNEYDFILFKHPTIIQSYEEIINHLKKAEYDGAKKILSAINVKPEEKSSILKNIEILELNKGCQNTAPPPLISHILDINESLSKYLELNTISSVMEWSEVSNKAILFYDSRLNYELDLIKQGFICKNESKESITEIIQNNISLLNSISNKTSLQNFTQEHMNELTRDINYLSHYPLRKIFIDKYKKSNFRSTGYHQLSDSVENNYKIREIEKFPNSYTKEDIELFLQQQDIEILSINNKLNEGKTKKALSPIKENKNVKDLPTDIDNFAQILKTELDSIANSITTELHISLKNFSEEISEKLSINTDQNPDAALFNQIKNKLDNIEQHISEKVSELTREFNKDAQKSFLPENVSSIIENFNSNLNNFQNSIHTAFVEYLENIITKQSTEAYNAAQTLEHNSLIMAEEMAKLQEKLESTNTLMEETKKYLSFKSFKFHTRTILGSTLLLTAIIGWVFVWLGTQVNATELNNLRPLKYEIDNACNIINSQEPKLKQNLLNTLQLKCSQ